MLVETHGRWEEEKSVTPDPATKRYWTRTNPKVQCNCTTNTTYQGTRPHDPIVTLGKQGLAFGLCLCDEPDMQTDETKEAPATELTTVKMHTGGCHCGAVRYEVTMSLDKTAVCNCSICTKAGYVLGFVPANQFKLLSGEEVLRDYQFNKKMAHHVFCSTCGIHSFSHGKSPDGHEMAVINLRCLDDIDLDKLTPRKIDGRSW